MPYKDAVYICTRKMTIYFDKKEDISKEDNRVLLTVIITVMP